MARIRTIKPDFWTDEKIVELSPIARLLFIGLWNFADDDGRMQFSPRKIKLQIFPADQTNLESEISELVESELINVYSVANCDYLQVNNFNKHQKIDKRSSSKHPPPPISTESRQFPPNPADGREGKGREKEWNGMDISSTKGELTTEYSKEEFSFDPDREVEL